MLPKQILLFETCKGCNPFKISSYQMPNYIFQLWSVDEGSLILHILELTKEEDEDEDNNDDDEEEDDIFQLWSVDKGSLILHMWAFKSPPTQ